MAEEVVALAAEHLGADPVTVQALPVTKITYAEDIGDVSGYPDDANEGRKEIPVTGAVLQVIAREEIIPEADGKVLDKSGKEITLKAGTAAYAKGSVIYEWTTDGRAVDLAPYLIAGGKYLLRETVTPDGYMKMNDVSFSIGLNGAAMDGNGTALTSLKLVNYQADPGQASSTVSLKLAAEKKTADPAAQPVYLAGAEFVIKDKDGLPLADASGNLYTFSSEAKVMTLNLNPELFKALTKDLENGGERSFRIAEIQAPSGYRVLGKTEAEILIRKNEQGQISLQLPEETENDVVVFYHEELSGQSTGSISVTKRNYFSNTDHEIYSRTGGVYYAALFQDEDREIRISDVKEIQIKTGYKSATVVFDKLLNGTYYVGETDQYGNPVGEVTEETAAKDPFYAEYVYDGNQKNVVIKVDENAAFDADPEKVTIKNRYFKMPEGFVYTASFQITKQVKDSSGAAVKSSSTFYAGIYTKNSQNGKYTYIGKKAIKMGGQSEKTITAELTMSTDTKYVMVKEVDANGKEVKSGSTYNITVSPSEIVLKQGETKTQTVTITNTKVASSSEETETETPVDPNNMQAELKLTKKVVYKNTPIRVNSVYYIGIFDDAELTKLRYKKAMTFTNASELTASLKVNLHKLESREVTFYFAEVDEQGNVLKGGKEFGYDISLNKSSITLNANNMADEVVVTNAVVEGGTAAQAMADPTSGLAGDSAALATAQNLAAGGNSSDNTKTGDDNPILQLIIVLIVSVVVILAIVVFMIVRRNKFRKERRDRRKMK